MGLCPMPAGAYPRCTLTILESTLSKSTPPLSAKNSPGKGKRLKIFEKLDGKKARDIKVLAGFIYIFCRERHRAEAKGTFSVKDDRLHRALGGRELVLCQDCQKLLNHGISKLLLCPYNPKPRCKKCETHCYAPGYRDKVRQVMRFSGLYLIKRGRLDLMVTYLF